MPEPRRSRVFASGSCFSTLTSATCGRSGGVRTVFLSNIAHIRDATPLADCQTVCLYRCSGVTDIDPLKSVRRVSVVYCAGVTDLSALRSLHSYAYEYPCVADAEVILTCPALGYCYRLSACYCTEQEKIARRKAYPRIRRFGLYTPLKAPDGTT